MATPPRGKGTPFVEGVHVNDRVDRRSERRERRRDEKARHGL